MPTDLTTFCVAPGATIREAIAVIDTNRRGIVLVVDEARTLIGTVTDGDARRAMLAGIDFNASVSTLLERKTGSRYAHPITAPASADRATLLQLLQQHSILHLPLLDEQERVVGLVTMDEFVSDRALPLHAVVMAGGAGSRLHPLTEELPKPMLPVGDRPLLEIIVRQLRESGITRVQVTTHHQSEKIATHFGDGRDFGIELSCVNEDRPLGTVGGLALLQPPKETTLVMNGDILTQVDFRAMLIYHREHQADLTVAVRQYDIKVPYGVIEGDGPVVRRLIEKPEVGLFVNAGIYLLEPSVYQFIPSGERFDMTDLIQRLLDEGHPVVSFPIRESWLDIGQAIDYEQAQEHVKSWPSP